MEIFTDLTTVMAFLGCMAFLVSVVTEVLKNVTWLDSRLPSGLLCIIVSLILCPVSMAAIFAYYGVVIEWYMVFASFLAAFVVALVAMNGWEHVMELKERCLKKK